MRPEDDRRAALAVQTAPHPRCLLPYDGAAYLHRLAVPAGAWRELREGIAWEQEQLRMFGKAIPVPRLTCWYGRTAYRYSGIEHPARVLPESIRYWIKQVDGLSWSYFGWTPRYNSVMCNLYRGGSDSVGWHSDDEAIFDPTEPIASISFGAPRSFLMRHKLTRETIGFVLQEGDMLLMGPGVQKEWEHSVPKLTGSAGERINLTLRRTL